MGTLVQFLAAGVKGAESGSATFVLRGTASSAESVLYSDFEGTTQPGTNVITLDANGAAEVYCDAYVDVQLRTSGGTLLRTVTLGNSAPLVEVQSASFTGTDYDNDPANTAGEPITLKAILDKWVTSAGAVDWKVLVNGVATNLETAMAANAAVFINVKDPAYGAEGDGVTDDTTAIVAALAAAASAGGGIVFFPPGTYPVTGLTPSNVDVVLMGCGGEASIINGNTAGTQVLRFTDNTAASTKRVTGLGFTASAAYNAMITVEENQQLVIDHCKFTGTNISTGVIQRVDADGESNVTVESCVFAAIHTALSAIRNLADDGEAFTTVTSCLFTVSLGYVGSVILGPDFTVDGCRFDASEVAGAAYYHISSQSNETIGKFIGSFSNNTFIDGGSDGFAFDLDAISFGCDFSEVGNRFFGFTDPTDPTETGHIYDVATTGSFEDPGGVYLGSRIGRSLLFVNASDVLIADVKCQVMAETIIIQHTNASDLSVRMDDRIPNLSYRVIVINEAIPDAARDITLLFLDSLPTDEQAAVPYQSAAVYTVATYVNPRLDSSGEVRSSIVTSQTDSIQA